MNSAAKRASRFLTFRRPVAAAASYCARQFHGRSDILDTLAAASIRRSARPTVDARTFSGKLYTLDGNWRNTWLSSDGFAERAPAYGALYQSQEIEMGMQRAAESHQRKRSLARLLRQQKLTERHIKAVSSGVALWYICNMTIIESIG